MHDTNEKAQAEPASLKESGVHAHVKEPRVNKKKENEALSINDVVDRPPGRKREGGRGRRRSAVDLLSKHHPQYRILEKKYRRPKGIDSLPLDKQQKHDNLSLKERIRAELTVEQIIDGLKRQLGSNAQVLKEVMAICGASADGPDTMVIVKPIVYVVNKTSEVEDLRASALGLEPSVPEKNDPPYPPKSG